VAVWGALPDSLVSEIQAKKRVKLELWGGIPERLKAELLGGRLAPPDASKQDAAPDMPLGLRPPEKVI